MIDKFYYYHRHNKVSLWLNDFDISLDYHSSINLIKVLNEFLDAELDFEDAQRYLHFENVYLFEEYKGGHLSEAIVLNKSKEQFIGVTDYITTYQPFLKVIWIDHYSIDFKIMKDIPEYVQLLERISYRNYRVTSKEHSLDYFYFKDYSILDKILDKVKHFRDTDKESLIKEQQLPELTIEQFKISAVKYYPILNEYIKRQKASNYAKL